MQLGTGAARPFYAEFAWAYDLLVDRSVREDCATIAAWLAERGVLPGAAVLDAGCGTGRYAAELARRGFAVHGIDVSAELIAEAKHSSPQACGSVMFEIQDILALGSSQYDAALCRGVLNDLLEDERRQAVLNSLAGALRADGVLILDVRDWEPTAKRKAREPVFTRTVVTDRGRLTFTSATELDTQGRRLMVNECHTLDVNGQRRTSDHQFIMRCWTKDELSSALRFAGFGSIVCFGAYDAAITCGATDRLVAVAEHSSVAA